MTLPLFAETRCSPIILLDLNHTLAENSASRFAFAGNYAVWITQHERYRRWLVELLRERTVLLVTARHRRYEATTLARIAETCGGWGPAGSYFRNGDDTPPAFKARAFTDAISVTWGSDPEAYLALESNAATRRAYARLGVRAVPVPRGRGQLGQSRSLATGRPLEQQARSVGASHRSDGASASAVALRMVREGALRRRGLHPMGEEPWRGATRITSRRGRWRPRIQDLRFGPRVQRRREYGTTGANSP